VNQERTFKKNDLDGESRRGKSIFLFFAVACLFSFIQESNPGPACRRPNELVCHTPVMPWWVCDQWNRDSSTQEQEQEQTQKKRETNPGDKLGASPNRSRSRSAMHITITEKNVVPLRNQTPGINTHSRHQEQEEIEFHTMAPLTQSRRR
jgi:hypothetical protein